MLKDTSSRAQAGDARRLDTILAVRHPLAFFTLAILIGEAVLFGAGKVAYPEQQGWLLGSMVALIFCGVLMVGGMAVFRPEALYGKRQQATRTSARLPIPGAEKLPTPDVVEKRVETARPIVGDHNPPPAVGTWYTDLRPVLHQAIQYTVPTYYLDQNLMVVDWNIAFDLIFSRLGPKLRNKHVKWFIAELANFEEVMDHAQQFTREVLDGRIPFVDLETLHYVSERYGEVSFVKVAVQLHAPDGTPKGWSVSLIIRDIDEAAFKEDLLEAARKDKLWGVYSAAYDRVLLEFEPYHQLIRDVTSVLPAGQCSVADLGAGTGNVTQALLSAGHTVTAVENNLGMLDRMRVKLSQQERLTVVKASVENLNTLPDESFEGVVMVNVLYATDDPLRCLQEVHRILKPGGVLGFSTTHGDTKLDRLLNTIKTRLSEAGKFDRLSRDYQLLVDVNRQIENTIARRYTREVYRDWVRAAGLTITRDVPSTYEDAVMLVHARKT